MTIEVMTNKTEQFKQMYNIWMLKSLLLTRYRGDKFFVTGQETDDRR